MKKSMYIFLIILGLAFLCVGIYGIISGNKNRQTDHITTITGDSATHKDNTLSINEQKGRDFEDFVVSRFSPADYVLVEKVNDYTSRHHVTERSKYADLVFKKKSTGEEFAIECKYRSCWNDHKGDSVISWVDQRKIDDYNHFSDERKIDVIVVFGVGGSPGQPESVYALPLRLLQKPLPQRKDFLDKFAVVPGNFEYISRQHNLQITR